MKGVTMERKKLIMLIVAVMALPVFALSAMADDAWIGIYTQSIDEDLKDAFELDSDDGVIIKMVIEDSPADEAGLEQGDIIIAIDGEQIHGSDHLIELVEDYDPDDKVKFSLIRDGDKDVVLVKLGERHEAAKYYDKAHRQYKKAVPQFKSKLLQFYSDDHEGPSAFMGVQMQDLNVQLGEYFGVKDGKGALIQEVTEDSPAEEAGLKAGDVIISIDGKDIKGPGDVTDMVYDRDEGDRLEVTVLRHQKEKEFTVELDEMPDHLQSFYWKSDVPDFDDDLFFMPKMKGLFRSDFDDDFLDLSDLEENLEELEEELEEMRREMKEIKKKLD